MFSGVSELALRLRVTVAKPDDLRFSFRTQMVEGENQFL